MPHKKGLTPFTHPVAIRLLVRRLYPKVGATEAARIAGVSVRSVYRWCSDLTTNRTQTAAAAEANRWAGERRRLERDIEILDLIDHATSSREVPEIIQGL